MRLQPSNLIPLAVAAASYACGLGDVFKTTGPRDVRFVWVGDTVVNIGIPMHFEITLLIDGVASSAPAVRVAIPDTTVINFASTRDSIVGSRPGSGDVVAWIESSLTPRVEAAFSIRARP